MTCTYCTVITADNDISMFHPSQSLCGFTCNVMIFDKIKKYANVYVLHGTKTNGNLDCSYYETYTRKNFSGIFTCMQNGRVVHYFEYTDLRFDGVEINLQKQKD